MRIVLPAVAIFVALGLILGLGLFFGSIPEVQVSEALGLQEKAVSERSSSGEVKIHGHLHKIYRAVGPLEFDMRDKQNPDQILRVKINSEPPDTFELDRDVSVIVRFDPETNTWEGDKIYTKCPSKYEDGGADVPYSEQGLPATPVKAEGKATTP